MGLLSIFSIFNNRYLPANQPNPKTRYFRELIPWLVPLLLLAAGSLFCLPGGGGKFLRQNAAATGAKILPFSPTLSSNRPYVLHVGGIVCKYLFLGDQLRPLFAPPFLPPVLYSRTASEAVRGSTVVGEEEKGLRQKQSLPFFSLLAAQCA